MVRVRRDVLMRPRDLIVQRDVSVTPAQVLTNLMLSHGPVFYAKNNNRSSTSPLVTDSSAGSHNMVGVNFNANDWQVAGPDAEIIPHAMHFDGVNEFSSVADQPDFNVGSAWTAMFWVNITAVNNRTIFSQKDTGAGEFGWSFNTKSDGRVDTKIFATSDGLTLKAYRTTDVIADNTYHHMAATFASSTLKIYVDGAEDTTVLKLQDDAMSSIFNSTSDLFIGREGNGMFTEGDICELPLYPSALSASEILEIYTVGGGT